MSQMQQCIIYARTAGTDQSQFSIQMQVATCRDYAQQKGWNVIAVYQDIGISGSTRKRKGLQAALKCLKKNRRAKFLVYAFDRLARDSELMLELLKEIDGNGSMPTAVATPNSNTLIQLVAQFQAPLDRIAFAERIRRGNQITREQQAAQNK